MGKSIALLAATSNVGFQKRKEKKRKEKKRKRFKSGVVAGLLNVVLLLGVKENRTDIKLLKVENKK
jgi:hypothetical protein